MFLLHEGLIFLGVFRAKNVHVNSWSQRICVKTYLFAIPCTSGVSGVWRTYIPESRTEKSKLEYMSKLCTFFLLVLNKI
jgi:hypothetical protein